MAYNAEGLPSVLEFKKQMFMNITEAEVIDLVFRYKAEHGLTAKDVDNEELCNFARWLYSQNSGKPIVSGSLPLTIKVQQHLFDFLKYHKVEEPDYDVRSVKDLADEIIKTVESHTPVGNDR